MAGSRGFDEGAVLDAAMGVFRARGFEGASVAALEAATGLRRGSLYNAWGSKEGLFDAAFARFLATVEAPLLDRLEAGAFRPAVAAVFDAILTAEETAETAARGESCLITLAALCGPGADAGRTLSAAARSAGEAAEDRVAATVRAAQARGEVAGDTDPADLAAYVLGVMRALPIVWRTQGGRSARAMARRALATLG